MMRRRFLVPETIQTSTVDCGPAALKSLLEGFGISASYGRLREACQTALDGTSIDTIAIVARELGLDAEQVMLPPDYLAIDSTALPAVVVIRLPTGYTHFVIVWRKVGPWFQIMDPAVGRRWVRRRELLGSFYVHSQVVSAADWREWAASPAACAVLRRRIAAVGRDAFADEVVETVVADPRWLPLARLDAATRMTESLVRAGALRRGAEGMRMIAALMRRDEHGQFVESIAGSFWTVFTTEDPSNVVLRGAVLMRVNDAPRVLTGAGTPEVMAAVRERPVRPLLRVLAMLSPDTRIALPFAVLASWILGMTAIAEGLLFRSLFDVVIQAGLPRQRLLTLAGFGTFVALLLALEYRMSMVSVRWGREIEARFSVALLSKLAALRSEYFGSRIISDMAERVHNVAELRALPLTLGRTLRSGAALVMTLAALLWLIPGSAFVLSAMTLLLIATSVAFGPLFSEIELRTRTHAGALTRFYLDALIGLTTVHAHSGERSVRRAHESLLTDWVRAARRQLGFAVSQSTALSIVGFALTAVMIRRYLAVAEDPSGVLLVAFWSLHLPAFAGEIAQMMQGYAAQRSLLLRLIEPLDAPDDDEEEPLPETVAGGVAIEFRHTAFVAGGHPIVSGVNLSIPAGAMIGVVGASGAGKSTIVGSLLGWSESRGGEIRIDGVVLTPARVAALRRVTAWVDPAVHLFNASLEENVCYAAREADIARLPLALSDAELYDVLQCISDSQRPLGESGGMLSGGEGQQVRIARAFMQRRPRLVILDEAFRGLDHALGSTLLRRCRAMWREATFLFVTHDVEETTGCDGVIVMQAGRVVEYDAPHVLAARADSLYARMRDADRAVAAEVWRSPLWRRIEIRRGRISSDAPAAMEASVP